MKIEIESYNMEIKHLDNEVIVAQIKPSVAFNPDFIEQCEKAGVRHFSKKADDTQE